MKFLVDKLPSTDAECPLSEIQSRLLDVKLREKDEKSSMFTTYNSCKLFADKTFQCLMGQEGFECPYLREFKAETHEPLNGRTFKSVPVNLKG